MMGVLSLANLTAWLVQIGVIATLGALLPMVFRIRHPRTLLIYCDAVLILALLLPSIQPWHHPVLITAAKPPAAAAGTMSAPQATGSASQPQRIAAPERVILWILAMGAAVKLGWLGSGLWRLRRYRAAATLLYPSPQSIWSARKITGTDALFCLSSSVSSPVTFGFVQPIVLVPRSFLELDTDAQVSVACHELLHIRRNDWIVTIFEELAGAILWFQPGVWWLLGQTRLAREQAVDAEVVRLTSASEPYINALLIMAGESAGLDLAPAPLFLRRRHLTARMHFLLEEVSMSRLRLISSYVLMLAILCGAGWLALGAFPLVGQAQVREFKQLSDNITVNPGGDLINWNILYPADALAKRVEGTVWVELTLRSNGDVGDARVISGPDELRRGVLQSVLQWRYAADSKATRTVVASIDFRLPTEPTAQRPRQPIGGVLGGVVPIPSGVIQQIDTSGAPESMRSELETRLRRFSGQTMSESLLREIQQTVRQVSPNIDAGIFRLVGERGNRISLVVMEHGEVPPPPLKPPASFVRAYYEALASKYAQQLDEVQTPTLQGTRVDPAVQNTKLIESPAAVYPPLAKASRTQGTVHLDIEIGPDGHVVKVLPLDGNPLLQQSARNAVFQWVYQPTIEAGQAISVITTVTINFSLAD